MEIEGLNEFQMQEETMELTSGTGLRAELRVGYLYRKSHEMSLIGFYSMYVRNNTLNKS